MIETGWQRRAVLAAMGALAATPAHAFDRSALADTDPFALGVASGDPSIDGFVLWTRLISADLEPLDRPAVPVSVEVARDPAFRLIVRRGTVRTHPERAHSVHVEITGLAPGRPYWYRFHALGATSPIGRAATVPIAADRLRLAVTSCQHWEQARFGVYRDIVAADPDLILQLGDYIYEQSYPGQDKVRTFGAPEPRDLAGYRRRHALYKTDPDLQAAHRACPWVVTWDDHEVLNDYANLANRDGEPPQLFAARRAAAYQAYFEHMPLRPSLWRGSGAPRLYRAVDWGELASLSILDTRQYRSAPPCAAPNVARNVRLNGCAEATTADATIMGATQEHWLGERFARERRPWTLIGQQVFFAPLYLDGSRRATFSDQWDGYAANRSRVLDGLSRPSIRSPIILSGDVHSFWINDVDHPDGRPAAAEVVTSALGAASPPAGRFGNAGANNPHVRYSNVERAGYVLLNVNWMCMTVDFRAIDDRTFASGSVTSLVRFGMDQGARRLDLC